MLIIYLGIYTFILAILWGLFIVAKIHAYKFKNFSKNITKVTSILLVLLIILSLLGYSIIIFGYEKIFIKTTIGNSIQNNINY